MLFTARLTVLFLSRLALFSSRGDQKLIASVKQFSIFLVSYMYTCTPHVWHLWEHWFNQYPFPISLVWAYWCWGEQSNQSVVYSHSQPFSGNGIDQGKIYNDHEWNNCFIENTSSIMAQIPCWLSQSKLSSSNCIIRWASFEKSSLAAS